MPNLSRLLWANPIATLFLRWGGCVLVLGLLGCAPSADVDLVVADVAVVDLATGAIEPGQDVYIAAGRIVDVRPAHAPQRPPEAIVLNGRGRYAIPGLWDMHVHALWDPSAAAAFLPAFTRAGVTGVLDMGGSLEVLQRVRGTSAAERRAWPRVFAAGPVLDGPEPVDPSISVAVSTPAGARQAVATLAEAGVDVIKVYTLLPRAAYFAVLEAAQAAGLPVVGHVPAAVSVAEAVAGGQVGIAHLRDELEPFCQAEETDDCAALIEQFKVLAVYNTPTLVVLEAKADPGYRSHAVDAYLPAMPEVVTGYWQQALQGQRARPEAFFERRADRWRIAQGAVGQLHRGSAAIMAGSDAGNPFIVPGVSLQRELELLVEAGLTPQAALRAATHTPAAFLGLADSVGAVLPGFTADIVLLDANPLADIRNVRQVSDVVVRGQVLDLR